MPDKREQYIMLPPRGLRTEHAEEREVGTFLRAMNARLGVASAAAPVSAVHMKVVDSIAENGAKLIELPPESLSDLRANTPGVRIVPVRYYQVARAPIPTPIVKPKKLGVTAGVRIAVRIISAADGSPVRNARVVAFTDFEAEAGDEGTTNAQGVVRLRLGGASKKLDRVYVTPESGLWPLLKKNFVIRDGDELALRRIDLTVADCLRHYYPDSPLTAGEGVVVGVVDTGTGPHPDLQIAGGLNCVPGETDTDFGDNGDMHGTHVGGIIAARGTPPTGVRGVAPGVTLRSYRVFPKGQDASNWSVAKAIDAAAADGCDLINLSLGGSGDDPAIQQAIADARDRGSVAIAAAGNSYRAGVDFPANDSRAIAVSAFGRRGTFPAGTTAAGDVKKPFGADSKNFIAAFSNIGPEIDLTGPGVGVISTVLGGYAAESGTSMACPAVAGAAARLLRRKQQILSMTRDAARADRIVQEILKAAKTLGFDPEFEGQGALP